MKTKEVKRWHAFGRFYHTADGYICEKESRQCFKVVGDADAKEIWQEVLQFYFGGALREVEWEKQLASKLAGVLGYNVVFEARSQSAYKFRPSVVNVGIRAVCRVCGGGFATSRRSLLTLGGGKTAPSGVPSGGYLIFNLLRAAYRHQQTHRHQKALNEPNENPQKS